MRASASAKLKFLGIVRVVIYPPARLIAERLSLTANNWNTKTLSPSNNKDERVNFRGTTLIPHPRHAGTKRSNALTGEPGFTYSVSAKQLLGDFRQTSASGLPTDDP